LAYEDPHDVLRKVSHPSEDWSTKRRILANQFRQRRYDWAINNFWASPQYSVRVKTAEWLGIAPGANAELTEKAAWIYVILETLIDKAKKMIDGRTVTLWHMSRGAEAYNVKCSLLDKLYEVDFLDGKIVRMTLKDIGCYVHKEHGEHILSFRRDRLSYSELLERAKKMMKSEIDTFNLTELKDGDCHFRRNREDLFSSSMADPYESLGDDNMSDGDWEDWMIQAKNMDDDSVDESEVEAVYNGAHEKLQSIAANLASLEPKNESLWYPNFRFCPVFFSNLIDGQVGDNGRRRKFPYFLERYFFASSTTPSALDFLQRVVEDVLAGVVIGPLRLHDSQLELALPLECDVLVGEHGTTITSFTQPHIDPDDLDDSSDGSFFPEMEED